MDGVPFIGFKEIARFAYTNEVKLDSGNMLDVLAGAIKFSVSKVRGFATDYIESNINPENVFKILQEARKLNIRRTEFKCYSFIEANPRVYENSQDFLSLDRDLLLDVIKICKLDEKAKDSIQDWAKHSCSSKNLESSMENMEQELGDLLSWLKVSEPLSKRTSNRDSENPRHPKRTTSKSPYKTVYILGDIVHKSYKEAILRVSTRKNDIVIKEIHFAFDLAKFGAGFELYIFSSSESANMKPFERKTIFQDGRPFRSVILKGLKLLGGDREYIIKVEFPDHKERPLLKFTKQTVDEFEHCSDLNISVPSEQETQIIEKIVYTSV